MAKRTVGRKDQILGLHRKHPKWTVTQIARELGIVAGNVSETFKRNHIQPSVNWRRLQQWERQAIADACSDGEKRHAVAAEFGVHPTTVTKIANSAGVPPGKPGPRAKK